MAVIWIYQRTETLGYLVGTFGGTAYGLEYRTLVIAFSTPIFEALVLMYLRLDSRVQYYYLSLSLSVSLSPSLLVLDPRVVPLKTPPLSVRDLLLSVSIGLPPSLSVIPPAEGNTLIGGSRSSNLIQN